MQVPGCRRRRQWLQSVPQHVAVRRSRRRSLQLPSGTACCAGRRGRVSNCAGQLDRTASVPASAGHDIAVKRRSRSRDRSCSRSCSSTRQSASVKQPKPMQSDVVIPPGSCRRRRTFPAFVIWPIRPAARLRHTLPGGARTAQAPCPSQVPAHGWRSLAVAVRVGRRRRVHALPSAPVAVADAGTCCCRAGALAADLVDAVGGTAVRCRWRTSHRSASTRWCIASAVQKFGASHFVVAFESVPPGGSRCTSRCPTPRRCSSLPCTPPRSRRCPAEAGTALAGAAEQAVPFAFSPTRTAGAVAVVAAGARRGRVATCGRRWS